MFIIEGIFVFFFLVEINIGMLRMDVLGGF